MSSPVCPDYEDHRPDPSLLWLGDGDTDGRTGWKRHVIGWAICGFLALISTLISLHLIFRHARNYTKPSEQRHIIRIVVMIPVYSIISFLSYRFYKEAIYYETIRDCYEAFVLYSFFVLLLTYLGDDTQSQRSKMTATEKRQLPFPLSCYFYNPLGDMFLHKMKWGILQYVVIKPTVALVSCVLHYYGLLCPASYSWHFGNVYLTSINFVSASVSLYCLVLFYMTINVDIEDHDPFLKFLCVKLVVFFCFWQSCVLSVLGSLGVFKPTDGWTTANVELGISALLICSEMVVFAVMHVYSFTYVPYILPGVTTNAFKSLWDGFNPVDLVREILWACEDISLILRGQEMRVRDQHSLSHKLQRANTIRATRRQRFINKIRNAHLPGRAPPGGSAAGPNSALGTTASTTPAPSSTPADSTVVTVPTPATQDPRAALLSHLDGGQNYQAVSRV
ncbi:hypothetical protein CPC16_008122 [Podila verticillata]|nr:hypothetical protein CPC16_008122 [Podila verticillata]KFH73919.1 hypothetical protein MVEG_01132 [Podila verticillata NRRL 6337]